MKHVAVFVWTSCPSARSVELLLVASWVHVTDMVIVTRRWLLNVDEGFGSRLCYCMRCTQPRRFTRKSMLYNETKKLKHVTLIVAIEGYTSSLGLHFLLITWTQIWSYLFVCPLVCFSTGQTTAQFSGLLIQFEWVAGFPSPCKACSFANLNIFFALSCIAAWLWQWLAVRTKASK